MLHSKIEYFRIRIRVEVNPYVGEIFTRIFLFPIGKEMCLCGKIKNLILCARRFALTPFRSVVVFISDFFAPFFRKTVNFLFFRVLGYIEGLLLKMEYFTKNCPWISGK